MSFLKKMKQKKNLANLLNNDYLVEHYLEHKKKKIPNPIFEFDLLDEADLARLNERIKNYKNAKKEKENQKLKKESEKREAEAKIEKEKREAEAKIEKEKKEAEARNQIYCDYFMMKKIINNSSDTCPVCGSRLINENKYEATVATLFRKLVGYKAGHIEAKPQYAYETEEKTLPAKSYKCPKCEYTVMSLTYEYYERYVTETVDITDRDSEEYRKWKKETALELHNYRAKTKTIKGFKPGRLYNSDIYNLADLALDYTVKPEYRAQMDHDAFHEKKVEKTNVITGNNGSFSIADEINKFYDLKVKGIISEEEFEAKKRDLLSK